MNPICFSCAVPNPSTLDFLVPAVAGGGFEGIEPTFTIQDGFPNSQDPAGSAARMRSAADANGLKIPSMRAGPAFWDRFLSPDQALRDEAVTLAGKAFEALNVMGGNTLLCVPGRWKPEQDYASAWKHAVETARRIGDAAKAAGIMVALENVENEFLCSPRDWHDLLTEIGHESVGMYFDVGNLVRNRQGPPARWLDSLGPRWVRRIHFKGAFVGGPLVSLLDGEVPWTEVIESMRRLNYRDWVGIELTPPAFCQEAWLKIVYQSAREILALGTVA